MTPIFILARYALAFVGLATLLYIAALALEWAVDTIKDQLRYAAEMREL